MSKEKINKKITNSETSSKNSTETIEEEKLNGELIKKYTKFLNSKEMVSYTEVKDIIGYKKKESVLDLLSDEKNGFIKDTDYKIINEKKEGVKKHINEIYMTVDTLKCICMMSSTEQSVQFRKYYLQMEKILGNLHQLKPSTN